MMADVDKLVSVEAVKLVIALKRARMLENERLAVSTALKVASLPRPLPARATRLRSVRALAQMILRLK